jgi:hypothetical protein
MDNRLHIISFAIPYPPDYGGAIDVFYRIKALHEAGFRITLHCFEYDRPHPTELQKYCEHIHYYKRDMSPLSLLHIKPYNVIGRKNAKLIDNLLIDKAPILFEGLVSCYYMNHPALKNRIKLFRECNIEHDYFRELSKAATSLYKKLYYRIEALKLKHFEKTILNADHILALSLDDLHYFRTKYPSVPATFIPCFHQNSNVTTQTGFGQYILYQGNLQVAENQLVATSLVKNVFSKLPYTCIIAGKNPSTSLAALIKKYDNIQLKPNPTPQEMDAYTSNAHIHVLITFQGTGLKLKLINALFAGRHIVTNTTMTTGSGLTSLCHTANSAKEIINMCNNLMNIPFTDSEIDLRRKTLIPEYSNELQVQRIKDIIEKL